MFNSTSRRPAMQPRQKKTTSQSENEYIFMLEKHVFGTLDYGHLKPPKIGLRYFKIPQTFFKIPALYFFFAPRGGKTSRRRVRFFPIFIQR